MRLIPVLDLKNGLVVRGVGGRRDEYRPVVSQLAPSARPHDVAAAIRQQLGLSELYVADLDAITGVRAPSLEALAELCADNFRLWVDTGIRDADDAQSLVAAGVHGVVAGLETIAGSGTLRSLVARLTAERVLFSLDLKHGQPLGDLSLWAGTEPLDIAAEAIGCGINRILVLDLARVGEGEGIGTEPLCTRLAGDYPHVEVIAGGGIRGIDDLRRLQQCGVKAALVASALHNGRIGPQQIASLSRS